MTSTAQMIRVFGRIGLLSFGGPAAQIALMHKELVEDRPWLSEEQYLRALSFCMLLPGPEAMQLATYAGWRLRGIPGGLIAGGLFVLPGAVVIAALALLYATLGAQPWVQAVFAGIQATVIIIVVAALRKLLAKVAGQPAAMTLAVGAFLALYVLALPFPLVIVVAAVAGALTLPVPAATPAATPDLRPALPILAAGAVIWALPVALAALIGADFLVELGLYFARLAVVTFGGAYAVLAYMAQTVVQDFGWVTTPQMMDGLGLAETTPGPLILVTQMVAMVAGHGIGGVGLALWAGAMALWVTFVPCFIWIFAGAPLIDWLGSRTRLQAALAGITAAVVGVMANLSLWFAVHVLFAQVHTTPWGHWPDRTSLQGVPLALTVVAGALILGRKWGLIPTMILNGALALAIWTIQTF